MRINSTAQRQRVVRPTVFLKPKGTNCLFEKCAVNAFWLCIEEYFTILCFGSSGVSQSCLLFTPLPAKLFNLNFHPLEVVSR